MTNRIVLIIAVMAAMAAGTGLGLLLPRHSNGMQAVEDTTRPVSATARKPLFYRNPMNPAITSPVPAKDEMGMDFIPVYADANKQLVAGTVSVDAATIQSIGVRTARVTRRTLWHLVRAPARVEYDERRIARLHPKVDGWVEIMVTNETGQLVKEGQVLLRIYSPNLVTSQDEYLLTLEQLDIARRSGDKAATARAEDIANAARQRLLLLDVPPRIIGELQRTRKVRRTLDIVSPMDGIVTRIGARQGQYVTPGTELFTIVDLSTIWVRVDVYEQDLPWISAGDVADMQVMAAPGRTWKGVIDYIYPYMDAKTRAAPVRLVFANDGGLLKPEMYGEVSIHTRVQHDAIVIPAEAVIRSGLREQVFIAKPGGRFEPRKIRTGVTANGMTQVLSGLQPGEQVVTSAQFLIDSESKLDEASAKMLEATRAKSSGTKTGTQAGEPGQ